MPSNHRERARSSSAPTRHAMASLGAALMLLAACGREPAPAAAEPESKRRPEVTVIVAQELGWTETFVTYGQIEPATSVQIVAALPGRVEKVLAAEGQAVEAGQALVKFEEDLRRTQLAQTKGNASAAKRAVADARKQLAEREGLARTGTIPRAEVESAEITLRQALERYEDLRASVRLASKDLADMEITSPVTGTVISRSIEPGESVLGGRELFTIATTDHLRLVTWVSEEHVNGLAIGAPVPVEVVGVRGLVFEGRVESVGMSADPETGNFEVRVALERSSAGLVRTGMTAHVRLDMTADPDAVVIPRSAVVERDRWRVVFVESEGVAHQVQAVLGIGSDDFVPVLEGLQAGDRVIVDGLAFVKDGVSVTPTVIPAPTPALAEARAPTTPPTPSPTPAPDPVEE